MNSPFVFFSFQMLAYSLYELSMAKNKHVQDKARDEIHSVLEQHNGELTYDGLSELIYCNQIIKGNFKAKLNPTGR